MSSRAFVPSLTAAATVEAYDIPYAYNFIAPNAIEACQVQRRPILAFRFSTKEAFQVTYYVFTGSFARPMHQQ